MSETIKFDLGLDLCRPEIKMYALNMFLLGFYSIA